MPNPHYQRVLQQDQSLPAPVRWLSRAMSSWWTILALGLFVVGYVFFAQVPILGKYLWQTRLIDTTQHAMLTWWPLLVAAWLLAAVIIWAAMRRLPWRIDNLGAFVAVLGLAIVLISQSWAFRSQTLGIAAVPISESTGNAQADALALNYTTRYGDTHERVLVVMARGTAPVTIPLDGIPRWNDAAGEAMPKLRLHDHPRLAGIIGYGTRITTSAYIAEGDLTNKEDGTQVAGGYKELERHHYTRLPYPSNALLALEITTDLEDGSTQTTTAWLPFEPEGTDSLVPDNFFPVEGLGSVGLAFRPASKKMPFALGATGSAGEEHAGTLLPTDADRDGRLRQAERLEFSVGRFHNSYQAIDHDGNNKQYTLEWLSPGRGLHKSIPDVSLVLITAGQSNPFILAGMITFVLGVFLDRLLDWLGSRPRKPKATSAPASPDKSSIPNESP